ncbi:MAG TPA: efflux RND transporter periplasmic adaptor subunit [Clostridia bacterium]|nr:efflux RND transporter periplasmic adaptor subunit [Clostridia bacterium]
MKSVPAVLGCGLLLTACKPAQQQVAQPTPEVATVTVAEQQVLLTTELPGHTAPFRIAEVRPQVNGLVQKRLFTEGADVKAGQELYQIDPAPFEAALANAQAALHRAEANLPAIQSRTERYRQALVDKAVSHQDFEDADAALKQAESDVQYYKAMMKTAQINLGYARVVSPIDGRIGTSTVTDGAIVTAYQPVALATIQQLDPIYVDVPQSATEVLRLQRCLEAGQISQNGSNLKTVELLLPDGTKYPLEGTLQFRDVSVDRTTGSVVLRMVFPNPQGVLLPGMFVRAVIKEGMNDKAILIPQQTVSRDPKGNPLALVVDAEGKVAQRALTLDRAIGDQWLVSSGLTQGERVIVEGMQKVRPGAAVKEVPLAPPQDQKAQAAKPAQQAATLR